MEARAFLASYRLLALTVFVKYAHAALGRERAGITIERKAKLLWLWQR
jgi:hypothetical protein